MEADLTTLDDAQWAAFCIEYNYDYYDGWCVESTTSDAQTLKEYYIPEEYLGYWSSPPYGPISGFSSYELPNDYTKIKGFNRFHCETSNLVVSCYKYQPSVYVSDDRSFVSTSAVQIYC